MKRFRKIYLEISNICNLKCSFCPGTRRKKEALTEDAFRQILPKLVPWTDYLYFHLMGEPLCHPLLERFLQIAEEYGFRVILTTNGTLLQKHQQMLLTSPALHKVNISLHAFEANDLAIPFSEYLQRCLDFGKAAQGKKLVVYRLWNSGGLDRRNEEILQALESAFPQPWQPQRRGTRIGEKVFLEGAEKFDWPDLRAEECGNAGFCYALKDQIGILCDGTVVPCCLDHEGDLSLGNIFREDLQSILASRRATEIYEGFRQGIAREALCRKCGYARRFIK